VKIRLAMALEPTCGGIVPCRVWTILSCAFPGRRTRGSGKIDMRARRIIEGAAFGPEVIRVAVQAFEEAWAEIADRFDTSSHASAREILANAIISAVRRDSADAQVLRGAGLRAMASSYPDRFAASLPSSKVEGKGN
jgi:hypothetical protein